MGWGDVCYCFAMAILVIIIIIIILPLLLSEVKDFDIRSGFPWQRWPFWKFQDLNAPLEMGIYLPVKFSKDRIISLWELATEFNHCISYWFLNQSGLKSYIYLLIFTYAIMLFIKQNVNRWTVALQRFI
jgi:hypothetical protein